MDVNKDNFENIAFNPFQTDYFTLDDETDPDSESCRA